MDQSARLMVAISKDVLKWVKPGNVAADSGYCRFEADTDLAGDDSKKIAKRLKKVCTVCGQGALLLSLVAKTNAFDFQRSVIGRIEGDRDIDIEKLRLRLREVFELDQLHLIESAFERRGFFIRLANPHANNSVCREFSANYKTDIGRLKAIMRNIIRNEGTFKPEQMR